MPSPAPAAEAALASCASLEEFALHQPALEEAEARLELARAVGALLMLEEAFERRPDALRVRLETDFEGGFKILLTLRGATGAACDAQEALLALTLGREAPDSFWAREELASEFEALGADALRESIKDFHEPFHAMRAGCPSFFWSRVDGILMERADAPSLARQLGAPEAACAIEAARIARSAAPGARSEPASRL